MRKLTCDKQAAIQLSKAMVIGKDSFQNADKVKQEILVKIDELLETPEKHSIDKLQKLITLVIIAHLNCIAIGELPYKTRRNNNYTYSTHKHEARTLLMVPH
ncbi:MAG: hypothetical protein WKG06_44715 [Segetibacter sp.]